MKYGSFNAIFSNSIASLNFGSFSKPNSRNTSSHVFFMMAARGSMFLYTRCPKPIRRYFLAFTPSMNSATLDTSPISSNIFNTASFAPPWEGPHRLAIPAAIQAKGFAPEEPAKRTVEVEAFCSWSACKIKILSNARTNTGFGLYSSHGVANIMCIKFAV